MLTKHKLGVDTTDLVNSDVVASYILSSAGTIITRTLVGSKEALDINLANITEIGVYAEDSPHTTGENGSLILAVRHDADTSLVSTDGDYAPYQVDSLGKLKTSSNINQYGGTATTLGQKASTASIPVVIASDQSSLKPQSYTSKYRVEPQNTTISVNNTVTYTTLYTYTGTGLLIGFNYEFAAGRAVVKLTIDGEIVMDGFDITTLNGFDVTTNNSARNQVGSGLMTKASILDFSTQWPIRFATSVTISARLSSGAALNFTQGIVYIQKDT